MNCDKCKLTSRPVSRIDLTLRIDNKEFFRMPCYRIVTKQELSKLKCKRL